MSNLAELAALTALAGRRRATEQWAAETDRRLAELVAATRANGATWQQVAQALGGVTRQAAQMRYGRKDDR